MLQCLASADKGSYCAWSALCMREALDCVETRHTGPERERLVRYLDVRQVVCQSQQCETRELALKEACTCDRAGNAVLSLEGPGERLTAANLFAWCAKNDP